MTSFTIQQELTEVNRISSQLNLLEENLKREEKELTKSVTNLHNTQAAQEVLQRLAQAVQQQAHQRISEVVSSCLSAVFGENGYQFSILFERKRGRTEAQLRFVRGSLDVDPLSASGGGVVDVAAFALRVSCLMLHRPRLNRIVVLDEPFKFVSSQYRENIRGMIEELSKDLDLQVVMVSHIEELEIGKIIQL